ncbi:hypothetical protein DFH06DRAFT_1307939 [Mycena polygramma]|nr:hypothetical protein DFH06DRAFT_1307939 [Mycena polygramma]
MSLAPVTQSCPSHAHSDPSFASQWAGELEDAQFKTATAIQVDDTVVMGLFSRITPKSIKREFFPALFSSVGQPINLTQVREFRSIVDGMGRELFPEPPTVQNFRRTTGELHRRLWMWGKYKMNLAGDANGGRALKWALQAYLVIIAPWSSVRLKVVRMGREDEPGFGLVASRHIDMGEYIYEAIGLYTIDFSTDHSFLSTIDCPRHGTPHVFWGPIRLINHDCRPNVEYIEVAGTRAMIVQALRPIQVGEELFVDYGRDFWEGPCPCRTCNPAPAASMNAHAGPSNFPITEGTGHAPFMHTMSGSRAFAPPIGPMAGPGRQAAFQNWSTTGSQLGPYSLAMPSQPPVFSLAGPGHPALFSLRRPPPPFLRPSPSQPPVFSHTGPASLPPHLQGAVFSPPAPSHAPVSPITPHLLQPVTFSPQGITAQEEPHERTRTSEAARRSKRRMNKRKEDKE